MAPVPALQIESKLGETALWSTIAGCHWVAKTTCLAVKQKLDFSICVSDQPLRMLQLHPGMSPRKALSSIGECRKENPGFLFSSDKVSACDLQKAFKCEELGEPFHLAYLRSQVTLGNSLPHFSQWRGIINYLIMDAEDKTLNVHIWRAAFHLILDFENFVI